MSAEDDKGKKADPVEDLKKGLGLLFRAAKGAVDQLPTDKLEDAVKTGAREVGRAIENVTETIEKEVFGIPAKKKPSAPPPPTAGAAPSAPSATGATGAASAESGKSATSATGAEGAAEGAPPPAPAGPRVDTSGSATGDGGAKPS